MQHEENLRDPLREDPRRLGRQPRGQLGRVRRRGRRRHGPRVGSLHGRFADGLRAQRDPAAPGAGHEAPTTTGRAGSRCVPTGDSRDSPAVLRRSAIRRTSGCQGRGIVPAPSSLPGARHVRCACCSTRARAGGLVRDDGSGRSGGGTARGARCLGARRPSRADRAATASCPGSPTAETSRTRACCASGSVFYAYSTTISSLNLPVMTSRDLVHWRARGEGLNNVAPWAASRRIGSAHLRRHLGADGGPVRQQRSCTPTPSAAREPAAPDVHLASRPRTRRSGGFVDRRTPPAALPGAWRHRPGVLHRPEGRALPALEARADARGCRASSSSTGSPATDGA